MSEVARVDVERAAEACARWCHAHVSPVAFRASDLSRLILSCAVEPEEPTVPSTTHDWRPSKDGWTCAACGAKPSEQRAVAKCPE